MKFFTIGVLGTTQQSFFEALKKNGITHFCDIRLRRGLRGSAYKYANATELQSRIAQLGIEYRHVLDLAPTAEVREIQFKEDKERHLSISGRAQLSEDFVRAYRTERLARFDLNQFVGSFPGDARVVLFCVEAHPEACHRSLVAAAIRQTTGQRVEDITPAPKVEPS